MQKMNKILFLLTVPMVWFWTNAAWACSVCFGDPDHQMSKGVNMAVLVLLFIIVGVLALFGAFIFYLWRRSKKYS
jgi:hypothetical protein